MRRSGSRSRLPAPPTSSDVLGRVQNELFDLGADLSVPLEHEGRLRVTQAQVDALEHDCDRFNADLPELKSFVLPAGTRGGRPPARRPHRAAGAPSARRSWPRAPTR